MFKKLIVFLILILLGCLVIIFALASLPKNIPPEVENTTAVSPKTPYWGIAGFSPVGFPNMDVSQIRSFYSDIDSYADLYGIHNKIDDENVLKITKSYSSKPVVLVIDYKDASKVDRIEYILNTYPQIKYLAIGNEVNLLYEDNREEYKTFVNKYIDLYKTLKSNYPGLMIFVTFQYETLIGKGEITGNTHTDNLALINDFKSHMDLIGVTAYPFFDYATPQDIPENYFDKLGSDLKIAITETGWPSNLEINSSKFNSNEAEQKDYLSWIKNVVSKNPEKFEFINWIFLNDIDNTSDLFKTIGLRDYSGNEKPSYILWKEKSNL